MTHTTSRFGGSENDARSHFRCLRALEQKVLWLSVWTVHHANHVRSKADGLKVGGHQASSASVVTLMTALYMEVLNPADRVAVKPHASPVFHAIQYLLGKQSREKLEQFRALGGAQSYPSRTKDADDVDFSTGSVGLGVAMTSLAALARDFIHTRGLLDHERLGRMVALAGDAELDEGNVFEVLLEGWKHRVRNLWWIVDYNRQSLDAVAPDMMSSRLHNVFRELEWRVVTIKYGGLLQRAFDGRGGGALHDWVERCPNALYSALAFQGGAAWRQKLLEDAGGASGVRELLDQHDDESLHRLMTNLGGHDLDSVLDAFREADDDQPTCFLAYTIKGYGLPLAGHKDNHAGLMTRQQVEQLKQQMLISDGEEWDPYSGLDVPEEDLEAFLAAVPFNQPAVRRHAAPRVTIPSRFEIACTPQMSTQEGFGRLLWVIARDHRELADRIVTTSPDVTISTSLGSWVNRRGVFDRNGQGDVHAEARIASPQKWKASPEGQHIELGIAENNLFILLAALGLSGPLFGTRLFPIGTIYDAFIARGLDALNYACYQDARFIVAATPSGLSLAPEGGAHQSVFTPLIGIGQPGLTAFEPAYVDELLEILRWSFDHLQADDGGAVYLRLSTRPLDQPQRSMSPELAAAIVAGGYWAVPATNHSKIAIVACGSVVPEAMEACRVLSDECPGVGLLVVTSADRLFSDWVKTQRLRGGRVGQPPSFVDWLLRDLAPTAGLVTILDGHPATLSWLGAVRGHRVIPLGVDHFGESGDIPGLFRKYGLDVDTILSAVASVRSELPGHEMWGG